MATLRFDKLTVKAQEAAQEFGAQSGQQQIEPIHLLWALLAQNDGVVPPLLSKLGVSPERVITEIDSAVARLPKTRSGKILRGTIKKIADGDSWQMPATIDDPAVLDEIGGALKGKGLGA